MTNKDLITKIRKSRIIVVLSVMVFYLLAVFADLYFTVSSEQIKESLLTQSPFLNILIACSLTAIGLIFYYSEKIIVEMNTKE